MQWVDAVIECWIRDVSLYRAMLIVGEMQEHTDESINIQAHTTREIARCREVVGKTRPRLHPSVNSNIRVQEWIANNFTHANNALWDGKYELARKWLLSGKDHPRILKKRF